MINKILSFKLEARQALFNGIKKFSDAVTTTLGPKGIREESQPKRLKRKFNKIQG